MQSLVNGQNIVWPGEFIEIEVVAQNPCDVSALLLGADEKVRDSSDFVFYNQPTAVGVQWRDDACQTVTLDLGALSTEHAICVISVDPDQPAMGAGPAPTLRLSSPSGPVAQFTPVGLASERAIVACEVYRRAGVWKVRAVGQGYAGGLAALVRAYGVEVDDEPPATSPQSPSSGSQPVGSQPHGPPPGLPVTQPAPNPSLHQPLSSPAANQVREALEAQYRLITTCRAIMDDASRSTAALQSTRTYAESRLHRRLEEHLEDPRLRIGEAADQARRAAQREHDDLMAQAGANHATDMAQLSEELTRFEQSLPAPMARWAEAEWQFWRPPQFQLAGLRIGELALPDAPTVRLPLLVPCPLNRPAWIDSSEGGPADAALMARTLLTRLLACYPAGGVIVHAIDPAGRTDPLAPIGGPGCQVQPTPAAVTVDAIRDLLHELTAQLDRREMALAAGMLDAIDDRDRIIVLHDFPTGLDDGCLALLRNLMDVGPSAGIQVIATGSDSMAGPVAQGLFRQFNRLPAGDGGVLTDGFGGVDWNFVPDMGPGQPVLDHLLTRMSQAT